MRKLLALNGIGGADVRVKTIEGAPARWNCLKRGECVAVPLGPPAGSAFAEQRISPVGLSTRGAAIRIHGVRGAEIIGPKPIAIWWVPLYFADSPPRTGRFTRPGTATARDDDDSRSTTGVTPAIAERTMALYPRTRSQSPASSGRNRYGRFRPGHRIDG